MKMYVRICNRYDDEKCRSNNLSNYLFLFLDDFEVAMEKMRELKDYSEAVSDAEVAKARRRERARKRSPSSSSDEKSPMKQKSPEKQKRFLSEIPTIESHRGKFKKMCGDNNNSQPSAGPHQQDTEAEPENQKGTCSYVVFTVKKCWK